MNAIRIQLLDEVIDALKLSWNDTNIIEDPAFRVLCLILEVRMRNNDEEIKSLRAEISGLRDSIMVRT